MGQFLLNFKKFFFPKFHVSLSKRRKTFISLILLLQMAIARKIDDGRQLMSQHDSSSRKRELVEWKL
jgi:hypothetical protein